ncbi:MAG: 50S ribosomal protein L30 [bacterium]
MAAMIKVTYVRSAIGHSYRQKRTIRALGLRKLHQSRIFEESPTLWGMIHKVAHLVKVEPIVEHSLLSQETKEERALNTTAPKRI